MQPMMFKRLPLTEAGIFMNFSYTSEESSADVG